MGMGKVEIVGWGRWVERQVDAWYLLPLQRPGPRDEGFISVWLAPSGFAVGSGAVFVYLHRQVMLGVRKHKVLSQFLAKQ